MANFCSDCKYLDPEKKKDGIPGYCKCSKIKDFILANHDACEKFEKSYSRRSYDKEKLYDEAKESSNKSSSESNISIGFAIVFFVVALIIFFIFGK